MARAATKTTKRSSKAARRKPREVKVRATTRSSGAKKQGTKKAPNKRIARRSSATTLMGMRLSNALDDLVNSPRGRKLLASALVAAAGAAAAALAEASEADDQDGRD